MTYMHGVYWCNNAWFPFHYAYCADQKGWSRLMKHLGVKQPPPYPEETTGRMSVIESEAGDVTVVVTINPKARATFSVAGMNALVVHECVHVWQELLKHIGEEAPGAEIEAYSIQAITLEILTAMERAHPDLFPQHPRDQKT